MHATLPLLKATDFPAIRRHAVQTLQVNLGYTCNMSCNHCHVNAGPNRREQMERANIDLVLDVLVAKDIRALDLTGGAPELNPHFRDLVCDARRRGVHVIDRCNLTILFEPGQADLAGFLAAQQGHAAGLGVHLRPTDRRQLHILGCELGSGLRPPGPGRRDDRP